MEKITFKSEIPHFLKIQGKEALERYGVSKAKKNEQYVLQVIKKEGDTIYFNLVKN